MQLKLIVALVSDEKTKQVIDAAREEGATGATTITSCRGEGLTQEKTFLARAMSCFSLSLGREPGTFWKPLPGRGRSTRNRVRGSLSSSP